MSTTEPLSRKNKYRVVTISLIVLIILISSLMAANFWIAREQARIIEQTNALGYYSDTRLAFKSEIDQLKIAMLSGNTIDGSKANEAIDQLNYYITLLREGGSYEESEEMVTIAPITFPEERKSIDSIYNHQKEFVAYFQSNWQTALNTAEFEQKSDTFLTKAYDEIDVTWGSLLTRSSKLSNILYYLQFSGVALLFLYFMFFAFYFIRQMKKSDAVIDEARQETRDILDSTAEGFFLLDKDMIIGSEYSKALEQILCTKQIAGRNFSSLTSAMKLTDRQRESVPLFIQQLYSAHVVERLIGDLNPLRKVELIDSEGGKHILKFVFSRVLKDDAIQKVLVSVRDISDAVRLEEKLQEEQEQAESQGEMITQLVSADYAMMSNFLANTRNTLNKINSLLRSPGKTLEELQEKAQVIARDVHSIKGEASALKLSMLVSKAEQFENKVKELREKPNLVGNDFLGSVIELEGMVAAVSQVSEWHEKIRPSNNNTPVVASSSSGVENFLSGFVRDIAARHNKQAALMGVGLSHFDDNPQKFTAWKDVIIQLLRNAVVHGLENPQERQQAAKSRCGTVKVSLETNGSQMRLVVEDDGAGLNFDNIKRKAIEKGMASSDEISSWSQNRLIGLIFEAGFSTHTTSDEDAGRGVGMDIIKERIIQQHGKLKIRTAPRQYTRFIIDF